MISNSWPESRAGDLDRLRSVVHAVVDEFDDTVVLVEFPPQVNNSPSRRCPLAHHDRCRAHVHACARGRICSPLSRRHLLARLDGARKLEHYLA